MNCRDVETYLPLYSGGELPRWRRFQVSRHLGRCDRCRASLAELHAARSAASEALRVTWPVETGDSVWESVRSKLPELGTSPVGARGADERRAGRIRAWRFALAPVAAVAAVLILLMVVSRNGQIPQPSVEVVTTRAHVTFPPVVESIEGPGVKILDFETNNPGVTIAWVFRPISDDRNAQ